MNERHGERADTPDTEPAPVITSKARTASWVYRNGNQKNAAERTPDEPAPTVHFGHAMNAVSWVVRTGQQSRQADGPEPFERDVNAPAPTVTGTTNRWKIGESPTHYDPRQSGARPRPVEEPAPTMLAEGLKKGVPVWTNNRPAPTVVTTRRSKDGLLVGRQMAEGEGENVGGWGYERPATTVAGDPRVFQPGGHHTPGAQSENAVRVTLEEASVLQAFPADYPWQGSRTKCFEQVGNAVCPPLARAVISALLRLENQECAA